ncbi:MAG: AraC family transcriptional regulator [Myxococcales bacterium]|nr:AraC family transcriptional regulator [Myxococcales bacterium]
MPTPKTATPRGIIQPRAVPRPFEVARWLAPPRLAATLAHVWRVRWAIEEREFVQHTLPHPMVHVVFEAGEGEVVGPIPRRFERRLVGRGQVLGLAFRPAAFRALYDRPLLELRDRRLPAPALLGPGARALARTLEALADEDARVELACAWLEELVPAELPAPLAALRELVERLAEDETITTVEQAARLAGCTSRTLQRRFDDAIGWSPQQVIRRRRIHEALAQLDAPSPPHLAELAARLGYCDQAHLSRDFTAMTGLTPRAYLRRS